MPLESRREFMKKAALGAMALSVIHANPSAAQSRREIGEPGECRLEVTL